MDSELHTRLAAAVGKRTYRSLGDLTGTHPETVRRYMQGQAPSAEFLGALCKALGINGSWLLTGRGPMRQDDIRADALGQANASELLTAISNTLSTLIERVERLEVFAQTLDARVRAIGTLRAERADGSAPGTFDGREPKQRATKLARSVGEAVSQRAPADAG